MDRINRIETESGRYRQIPRRAEAITNSRKGPLDHPLVLLMIGTIFVLGQLADLLGTYIAQPHLEHEGNWLFMGLKSIGIHPGWNSAVLGKSIVCALGIASLEFFAAERAKFYPPVRLSGSQLIQWFVHGHLPQDSMTVSDLSRKGPVVTSSFADGTTSAARDSHGAKSSRDVHALLVLFAGFWAISGPIYLYMGYDNLAAHYGWFRFTGFYVGGVYATWGDFILMLSTLGGLLFLIEADHHALARQDSRPRSGYGAGDVGLKGLSS